ncbi:MAG: nucleoside recognition domain-containing protein, partial [Bacteroidales bacterium]
MKYKINNSNLDRILTHRFWGLLIFLAVIWIMFFCTFKIGSYPQQWIEILMGKLSIITENSIKSEWLSDFIQNGIINGIGSVLTFLPNILILFFFISLLQETEYLPRAARLMDKYMHGIGLHGSSFIPLLMGFGCNVPAIMATRTIERKNDRILTIMMIPYIPCSARIPTFLLFSGIFFPENSILVMMLLYIGGLLTGVVMALINKRLFFNEKKEDYVIELPELRAPSLLKSLKSMWDAAAEYLKK